MPINSLLGFEDFLVLDSADYYLLDNPDLPNTIILTDHLGGFDSNYSNRLFDKLKKPYTIITQMKLDEKVQSRYPHLDLVYSHVINEQITHTHFDGYQGGPELNYKNFVCSFNGWPHVGRQLLVSALNKFGYYNKFYTSKNHAVAGNQIDGHISTLSDNARFDLKFFDCTDSFNNKENSFGWVQYDHKNNIYNLEKKLTESFLHIVSETMSTSYCPFITEKVFYSVVTKGLFLAYGQPNWHAYFKTAYGFKLYNNLFDYRFDSIRNPVSRLIELLTMISKFSRLTPFEWHDLYLLELENIEYNYDHYRSKDYLNNLKMLDNTSNV